MAIPSVNKLQLGQEATFMTPATPTIQPAGVSAKITPRSDVQRISIKQGTTMPKYSFVKKRWSEVSISGLLDYNRAMLWLDGLFGYDGTSPHTYLSSPDWVDEVPKGLTMVYGQSGSIYRVAGILPSAVKLTAQTGEPWKFEFKGFGQPATDGATLEALTTDTPELVHGYETSLYMDEDLDATIGTTARANIAFSFEANIALSRAPLWHLGNQEPDDYVPGVWDGGSYKLVVQADATALDSLGDIIDAADTGKGFTIRNQATDGTNTMKLDFCGVAEKDPEILPEFEGVNTVVFDLAPQENSVYGGCWGAELTIA